MSPKRTLPATGKFCYSLILPENDSSVHLCGTVLFPKGLCTHASLVTHLQSVPERVPERRFGDCKTLYSIMLNGTNNVSHLI